jgi:transposase
MVRPLCTRPLTASVPTLNVAVAANADGAQEPRPRPDRPARHPACPRRPVRPVAAASWTSSSCGPTRARLGTLLRLIADFDREIDALADEIDRRATHDPRVDVLRQIYGIGRYLGMLIVAEIGAIERFPSARHLCAWAGLTPTVRSSDARTRLGHISHQGSGALRWALVEAAQKACQGGEPLRQNFERIAKRRARTIAKVAVARKILTLCYYGLIRCLRRPGRASAKKVTAPPP